MNVLGVFVVGSKSCVKIEMVSVYMIAVGFVECALYVHLTEEGSNGAKFNLPFKSSRHV